MLPPVKIWSKWVFLEVSSLYFNILCTFVKVQVVDSGGFFVAIDNFLLFFGPFFWGVGA